MFTISEAFTNKSETAFVQRHPGRRFLYVLSISVILGLEIKFYSQEPNCIFKSYLKVFCMETSTQVKINGSKRARYFDGPLTSP